VKTQLLCTFAHRSDLNIIIDYIQGSYEIPEQRIFVFANADASDNLYCTYNGVLDKTYQLDWSMYQNSFILTDDAGYRIIDLVFYKKFSWR